MISKTGEVAIYAASLRFCPIVKFSGYEKFITVKDKRLGIKAIRTSYPQPIQLYIFVLYFIHNNKEALTFLTSTYND